MKKILFLINVLTMLSLQVFAQKDSCVCKKARFSSSISGGLVLGGEGKYSATISTVNGVQVGTWQIGAGIGIDYYGKKRSVPLFLDIRKDITEKKKTFFVFADGGYNFPWLKDEQKGNVGAEYKAKGGLYYGAGIGYKMPLLKKSSIGFSAGYSVKQHEESYNSTCNFCTPGKENYEYTFRRISLQLSYWFL